MNKDLIENHLKNIESLEKHKISNKKIKKKIDKYENLSFYNKLKSAPGIIYSSGKYSYLFILAMILYFIVYEKKKTFLEIFEELESKKIF